MSIVTRIFGDPNERELKRLRPYVAQINQLEDEVAALSDDDMRARTVEFREQLDQAAEQGEQDDLLETILPEAFALVREASQRTLGMRPYDVQLIGGVVLHQGNIAEMRTGEGKTLVATLPSYLNALTGRGVHVVTTNDYLASRDAEMMGRIHRFLGLSVGCILSGPDHQDPVEKRAGYAADITYGTNNEFGFDYLRDNMVGDINSCVLRQLNYAIVDEVDNILIDEARTPLIISGPTLESPEMYVRFARVMPILKEGTDYEIDQKTKTVAITDVGIDKVEAALGVQNVYGDMMLTRYLENALRAHAVMLRDRDYIVENSEVIIIDEHTGRKMYGRRYNEGLHQAIEAKERVKIQAENRTIATITFQNYFRLYRKLSGMTGTALTEAQEFDKIYKLDVIVIPTHRPMIRRDETDLIYKTEAAKFDAVVEDIATRHEQGQPVLVGTTSVDKSEMLAKKLDRFGLPYELLNAKNHGREASIIAQAGRLGAVTISTNMAGRGTDIMLGGNPEGMVDDILQEWEIDLEFATDEDRAEALEEARRRCAEDHERVVALGGLHVIGTERHDSRRIDNQLRGRSGRQGDPGSTRFFVSLQDELMRRFGSDRVATLMTRFGLEDDVPIESGMAAKMIEQAQTKVEAYYFDIRKNIVEYDDVIARQREVIYKDRQDILAGESVHDRIVEMITEEVTSLVQMHTSTGLPETWNLDAIELHFERWKMPFSEDFFPENINQLKREQLVNLCVDWALDGYERKRERLDEQLAVFSETKTSGEQIIAQFERNVMLRVVDILWMDHIDALDVLRSGIGLRSVAQRDPLVEFKNEAFAAFEHLKQQIAHFVVENVIMSEIAIRVEAPPPGLPSPLQMQTNSDEIAAASGQPKIAGPPAPQERPKPIATVATALKTNEPRIKAKRPMTQNKKLKVAKREQDGRLPTASSTNGHAELPPTPIPALTATASSDMSASEATPTALVKGTAARTPSRPLDFAQVGPNDPCPCGSKQKYRFCHGVGGKR